MTSYFVNGLQEQTGTGINGQNMTGGDDLFVSSTGDIVALGGGAVSAIFLDSNSNGNNVTINGQLYCAAGDAIYSESADLNLVLNGTAYAGVDGINLQGVGNIFIGSQGELSVYHTGIYVGGNGAGSTITIDGSILSAAGTGLDMYAPTIVNVNAGAVISAKYDGVIFETGSAGSTMYNDGTIESSQTVSVDVYVGDTNVSVDNAGTITGPIDPVGIAGANATILNSGTISSQNDTSIVLFSGESNATIDNTGLITGGIQDDGGTGPLTIHNSGTITALDLAIQAGACDGYVLNGGTIRGGIDMGTGLGIINNDGKIIGDVSFEGAGDALDNSGTIKGNLTMGTGDTVTNTGTIHGGVYFTAGTNVLNTSHGEITGLVEGGSGTDTFIGGAAAVTFIGGSGTEVLTGGSGDDTIVAGSGKDTITGGKGDDTLTAGKGTDTFMYSGNFGNDTISAFNVHHDFIHFAANDFTSYSELQSHMAQVGTDVVITLDASDSIVLTHETLASFTSTDFIFG